MEWLCVCAACAKRPHQRTDSFMLSLLARSPLFVLGHMSSVMAVTNMWTVRRAASGTDVRTDVSPGVQDEAVRARERSYTTQADFCTFGQWSMPGMHRRESCSRVE